MKYSRLEAEYKRKCRVINGDHQFIRGLSTEVRAMAHKILIDTEKEPSNINPDQVRNAIVCAELFLATKKQDCHKAVDYTNNIRFDFNYLLTFPNEKETLNAFIGCIFNERGPVIAAEFLKAVLPESDYASFVIVQYKFALQIPGIDNMKFRIKKAFPEIDFNS